MPPGDEGGKSGEEMTIHAYTELSGPNPAYINISERASYPGNAVVTVRATGENNVSSIYLTREQLLNLSNDIAGYLGTLPTAETYEPTPAAGLAQLRQMTALLQRQVELMELGREEHREAMTAYNAMTTAYQATAILATSVEADGPKTITFDEFVQYGRDNGANIVSGMPWSFSFHGHPVTHENDRCYLIGVNDGQVRFTPDDVLVVNPGGSLAMLRAKTPEV
jgi:hypothetical protein